MFRRSYSLVALVPLALAAAACGDKAEGGLLLTNVTTNTVLVRFINATSVPISVNNGGVVVSGSSNLVFGATSSCVPVDVTNVGALTFTSNGAALPGFSTNFTPTGPFSVVAFTNAAGTTQFGTINTNVTPTSGSSALQVFNAATGTQPLTIFANGTALSNGATVPFGTSTNFLTVPTGSVHLTANNGTQVIDLGTMTLTAGQTQTLVIGPPATGSTTFRSFTATGC